MLYCAVNDQPIDVLSVKNRGFAYGDGLFTTATIVEGKVAMLSLHLERLINGCQQLSLEQPDVSKLKDSIEKIAINYNKAVLKVVITAGDGGRGYSRLGSDKPTVVISVSAFPQHYPLWQETGINLGISKLQLGINPMLSGLKHLNRLEQVLIRQELDRRVEDDLLVTDINGHIIESSCANVFWLKEGRWHTPKISNAGVAGLMRRSILKSLEMVDIDDYMLSELDGLEAMFICNCVMGVVPIKTFNGKLLSLSKVDAINKLIGEISI